MASDILVSIVIPSKNEEGNVARCLESLLKHSLSFNKTEIILVDCYSSDKTVEIASKYPIKILQLKPNWIYAPSAARYIGGIFASGEFVFFIDADMSLEAGFLEKAIDILNQDKNIAAAGGIGKEIYLKDDKVVGCRPNLYNTKNSIKRANFLGGAALYRKKTLLEVDGFNPYLRAAEENELAQRLRKKNYNLISIPLPMITHYTPDLTKWEEFMRKKKMNLFLGIGEAIRLSHSVKYLFETLFYYKEFTLFLTFISYESAIAIYLLRQNNLKYAYLFFLPLCVLILFLFFKKSGLKNALLSLVKWFILSLDIMRGLIGKPQDPKTYPKDPYIIKGDFNV